jgi:hypothetical protein
LFFVFFLHFVFFFFVFFFFFVVFFFLLLFVFFFVFFFSFLFFFLPYLLNRDRDAFHHGCSRIPNKFLLDGSVFRDYTNAVTQKRKCKSLCSKTTVSLSQKEKPEP